MPDGMSTWVARDARRGHGHGVVIMRAAVKNVPGAGIGQAHNGVICGRLGIISIGNRLRKAVEVAAAEQDVAAAAAEAGRAAGDKPPVANPSIRERFISLLKWYVS